MKNGQIVVLNNGKEYMVVNEMPLHNINYVFLMTTSKPLEIVIATKKEENGDIVLSEVNDNSELDYILSKFSHEINDGEE